MTALRSDLEAILLVLSYEQLRLRPYDDGVGVMTTGWGHRILPGETDLRGEISRDRANRLFVEDFAKHEGAALRAIEGAPVELSPLQVGAISSLCFNIGPGAFAGSSVAKAIRAGELQKVPAAIKLWKKGRVKGKLQVMRGLVLRRASEVELWERGSA